jgi:hypothetical protein
MYLKNFVEHRRRVTPGSTVFNVQTLLIFCLVACNVERTVIAWRNLTHRMVSEISLG